MLSFMTSMVDTTKWAEAVAETNQLLGRGLVLMPGCAVIY